MFLTTTKDEVKKMAGKARLMPVFKTIPADMTTPVTVYSKVVSNVDDSFLFESAENERTMGRFSIIGWEASEKIIFSDGIVTVITENDEKKIHEKPSQVLRRELQKRQIADDHRIPLAGFGAVGFWSYDYVRSIEKIPYTFDERAPTPDMMVSFFNNLIIFDHLFQIIYIIRLIDINDSQEAISNYSEALEGIEEISNKILFSPLAHSGDGSLKTGYVKFEDLTSDEQFVRSVKTAKDYIRDGEIYQVVLSRQFKARIDIPAFEVYRALRMLNPSVYMFYVKFGDILIVGASPERLVKVKDGTVETLPIAGTRPRTGNFDNDSKAEEELLTDPKELAEHNMLVDLGRNDLGRVCKTGSVKIANPRSIMKLSHVIHMTTRVYGDLAPGKDALDALDACFPAGTVSGTPKIRAMQIIDELEEVPRGPYAGAVGYVDTKGDMNLCIAIRMATFKGDEITTQAGAGIVYASDPLKEAHETRHKAAAMIKAANIAHGGLPCI